MRGLRTIPALAVALALVAACQAEAAGLRVIKAGDNYKVMAETRPDAKNPLAGVLAIVIEPTSGWKMEREKGPAGFELEPPAAVELTKKSWKKADAKWEAGGKRIRFEVPYKLAKRGQQEIQIRFRFVICTDKLCQMKRFELPYQLEG